MPFSITSPPKTWRCRREALVIWGKDATQPFDWWCVRTHHHRRAKPVEQSHAA